MFFTNLFHVSTMKLFVERYLNEKLNFYYDI